MTVPEEPLKRPNFTFRLQVNITLQPTQIYVPITPVQRKVDCFCYGCKIIQIPLRLGWGTTIHRCQGMTIGDGESSRYIVINPGTKKFESLNPGALFVALSITLQNVALLDISQ
jgi:hypothetical protein